MARRRRLPRYKKTAFLIAGLGVAAGLGAVILWPYIKKVIQTPLLTVAVGTRVGNKVWNGTEWVPALTDEEIDFANTLPY